MGHDNVAGQSSTRGVPVVVSLQSESHTLDDTGTAANVPGPTRTELGAGAVVGAVQGEEGEDEAGSQPMEPYVGMRFDTLQIAKDHYNSYALRMGFSLKMNTSRRTGNVLVKQQFCCNKYKKLKADDGGAEAPPILDPIPDPRPVDTDEEMEDEPPIFAEEEAGASKKKKKRKREPIKQTQCKAKMLVKLMDGRWEVTHFVRDHNHPLVNKPSLSKYLRSHQGISPDEKEFLRILYNCNLTTGRMMHVMAEFYGSEMMVPFGPKAITNLCTSFRRDDTKEGDLIETIAHFKDIQKTDPDFFYKVKYDEEDRVVNIFWVDGFARKAYAEVYHDCISFDTTYMTNMYNMPFAPFIGINRHGQSFMLGCAFVRQELASSFDWVFGAFLEAMDGKPPDNFITDQDGAMRQSIQSIFPTIVHRCCRWHIMKKAQEKVGWLLCRNPGLSDDFNKCVDFSFTIDEFEQNWAGLMMKYEAMTHTEKLYEYRSTWVPCYFKHMFFPFLQSTQRSEGFNAVLKRYVNPHNSMLNFVKQYEKIQNHILAKEGCNDYRTEHLEIELWSNFPIEKQAYKTYTRDLYRKFIEEFELIGRYNAFQVGADIFELRPNQEFVAKYGS
ncbi:protein FAR1-RELATED SEQUENCE 5-like [Aegilops tauschii subsp. strangulata]|uniref:protein FAR1-RELATED SEQUENCE 5-like n=1 Tax=Aegilops tauschii subsp. strangulata TaxID=200361 RepID=UPI000989D75C